MMMNNLLGIFSAEFASTVLGLTGQGAAVGEVKEFEAKAQSGINPPVITASVSSTSGKLLFMATPLLMTAINDIMLGEEKPTMNENIGDDELDFFKLVWCGLYRTWRPK